MSLSKELKAALADRFFGWELVEYLQIPAEDVIEAFEDVIEANWEDVRDFADLRDTNEEEE